MSFKILEGQTARWTQHLQEHCQSRKHNNADAISRRPCGEECTHSHKIEAAADVNQIRAITAVAAAGWDPAALRTEQLNDQNVGPILEEVETRQRPEWKDIATPSPRTKATGRNGNPSL
jgi:hypothetical protein